MVRGFQNLRFHATEHTEDALQEVTGSVRTVRGISSGPLTDSPTVSFNSDEAAARYFLNNLLHRDARPTLRGMTAPERPEMVPDLRMIGTQEVPQTKTRLVRFEQTQSAIPIFGTLAVVELDQNRELVAVDAEFADIRGVSPIANISPADSIGKVADAIGVSAASLGEFESPKLTFFHNDKDDTWHLAYYLRKVPGAPSDYLAKVREKRSAGHGLGRSPRENKPLFDYLVDAHDGTILFFFSATPMVVAVPSRMQGVDEDNTAQTFWGNKNAAGSFEMLDPIRLVKTYDFGFGDIDNSSFPPSVISNPLANLLVNQKAGVSAHVNATRVFDFYKSVLLRDSIDDKGMELISVINCVYQVDEHPPEWHNAVWYNNRMWYGQVQTPSGLQSFSRYLDVIAHELTHGVTEHTSDLIYRDQSGALNESFSDIFGVAIKNWAYGKQDSVANWDWEIGAGLGQGGLPLRDMSNPKRTGDPDHMNNYLYTSNDNGGVHTNSNIHNKAAYNVFSAKDEQGNYVFTPREVATLYYLSLTRLNRTADFAKTLQVLLDVANTYYAGDPAELKVKSTALKDAYHKVGVM